MPNSMGHVEPTAVRPKALYSSNTAVHESELGDFPPPPCTVTVVFVSPMPVLGIHPSTTEPILKPARGISRCTLKSGTGVRQPLQIVVVVTI
jgi:hypothetical protein